MRPLLNSCGAGGKVRGQRLTGLSLKRLALFSPVDFAATYLNLNLYPCQRAWTRNFSRRRLFHAAPRDHGKSIVYSYLLPLWELYRDPNLRILLVSKTQDLATRFLSAIKREIESNELLLSDFGSRKPDRPPPTRWTNQQIYCKRPLRLREPTVKALPFLGSCTGLRADLIIVDDPIDMPMCLTRRRRERCRDWFFSELTPVLEPDGRLLVVGTRKHYDDLYATLIGTPGYEHVVEKAVIDEDRRIVLCPEKWSFERLMQDKAELGSYLWTREKQNEIVDEEKALFKIEWLENCLDESLRMGEVEDGMMVYQGIDLSLVADRKRAEEHDTDFTVILTLGIRRDGTRVVVDYYRDRGLSPNQIIARIIEEARKYRPVVITIENNLFQRLYEMELVNSSDLPLKGHTTTKAKADLYEGIPSLSVLFENRKVLLPAGDARSRRKSSRVIQEFHGLGLEAHDDLVMALWLASIHVPMHVPKEIALPSVGAWPKKRIQNSELRSTK